MDDKITVENNFLYEFVLDEYTSLYYNIISKLWYAEYIDLDEDGEEYTESIPDLENLDALRINDVLIEKEELKKFLKIVQEDFNED